MKSPVFVGFVAMACMASAEIWVPANFSCDQSGLEFLLCHRCIVPDYFPDGEPPYVPMRNRDALADFRLFIERSGWTTNRFVEGLVSAARGNRRVTLWRRDEDKRITENAVWKLSEINHPAVTNYFRELIATQSVDWVERFGALPVNAMFCYTNLEPEVLDYMKGLCCRTNLYEKIADIMVLRMLETLRTMPSEQQPAATNRLARYMYYTIRHTTRYMAFQDCELAKFIPSYSNSIQRLEAMRYVESTATNVRQRVRARMEIERLSALQTNQLNDVSWIVEE